jgi:hypothetical protein
LNSISSSISSIHGGGSKGIKPDDSIKVIEFTASEEKVHLDKIQSLQALPEGSFNLMNEINKQSQDDVGGNSN